MEKSPAETTYTIHPELARRVMDELGQNVYLCYQCVKCSSGCPMAAFFDWQPNQIMRSLQLGQDDIALESKTPWLCAACQTCSTRCPQGLDIAAIMEFLTRESVRQGKKTQVPEVGYFNQAFMREIRLWGRSYEVGLMVEMKLRTRNLLGDMDLGVKMLRRNKLPFLPNPTRIPKSVKRYPGASDAVAYYPGCSLHSTASEFNTSAKAVAAALDVTLVEPPGWICCGSSAAHRTDTETALRLPYENLAMIEQSGFREVTMPCAACFNRHKTTLHAIHNDPAEKQVLDKAVDYTYQDKVRVTNLVDSLSQHAGLEKIRQKVRQPLTGLKVVAYYGCLLTRPPEVTEAPHPENPTEMDQLLSALGAEVVDWSYKTVCCGAAHSLTRPDIVLNLSRELIQHARDAGADVIAVACPLCHTNLDARQFQMGLDEPLPVLYFTQLMAVALGLPVKAAALHKNLVDPRPLLAKKKISPFSSDLSKS